MSAKRSPRRRLSVPHRNDGGPPATTSAAIEPHRWCGECDGLIGPFPHPHLARAFAGAGPAGGAYEAYRFELLLGAAGVYLRVTRTSTSTAFPRPQDPHPHAVGPHVQPSPTGGRPARARHDR